VRPADSRQSDPNERLARIGDRLVDITQGQFSVKDKGSHNNIIWLWSAARQLTGCRFSRTAGPACWPPDLWILLLGGARASSRRKERRLAAKRAAARRGGPHSKDCL